MEDVEAAVNFLSGSHSCSSRHEGCPLPSDKTLKFVSSRLASAHRASSEPGGKASYKTI